MHVENNSTHIRNLIHIYNVIQDLSLDNSHQLNYCLKIRNVLIGGRVVDIEAAVFDNEAALPKGCSGLIGLRFLSLLGD